MCIQLCGLQKGLHQSKQVRDTLYIVKHVWPPKGNESVILHGLLNGQHDLNILSSMLN